MRARCVRACMFFNLFIFNMLHYNVILHVPVFLILNYVLLYNKIVLKMSLIIPQDVEFRSGLVQGLSSSVFESL